MNDFDRLLNWYLGVRTKMTRGLFNIVFFVALLPALYLKMGDGLSSLTDKENEYAPLMEMAETVMKGGDSFDAYDVEGVMNKSQKTRDITRKLMHDFNFGVPPKDKTTGSSSLDMSGLVNLFMFLLLIPIIHMRLRDLGKWGNEMWVYTAFIYSGMIVDSLKEILSLEFPLVITGITGALTFVLTSWLCMAKSRKTKIAAEEDSNYMPGDKPSDPY